MAGITAKFYSVSVATIILILLLIYVGGMVRYISNNQLGVFEKMQSSSGSIERSLIALKG